MTGEKLPGTREQPGLTVEHCSVSVEGQVVGLAVSLGSSVVFYTTDQGLQDLDGVRFDSLESLRTTVMAAVREAQRREIAA